METHSELRFGKRLAAELSDALLVGPGPKPRKADDTKVTVRTHFRPMGSFKPPGDDPLDARDDPLRAEWRKIPSTLRKDFESVEPTLFEWLAADKSNPEKFAENPAAVIRTLDGIDAQSKKRLSRHFAQSGTRPLHRFDGVAIDDWTFDINETADVLASHQPQAKQDLQSDLLVEIGFSQLRRVLDQSMVQGIRDRAAAGFSFPVEPGNAISQLANIQLLAEGPNDPEISIDPASPENLLSISLTFPHCLLGLTGAPVGDIGPVPVGSVTVEAKLRLAPVRTDDVQRILLELEANSISISEPDELTNFELPVTSPVSVADILSAARAKITDELTSYYGYAVNYTHKPAVCGIQARGVTPRFLAGGESTEESLALFISALAGSNNIAQSEDRASGVPLGSNGHLLASNALLGNIACCILKDSQLIDGLGEPDSTATTDDPCCRWNSRKDVRIQGQKFNELKELRICADGELGMYMRLIKKGFGWKVTVTIEMQSRLVLENGSVRAETSTSVVIDKEVATWAKVLGVILVIVGAAAIIVGKITGLGFLVVGGVVVAGAGLALLLVAFILKSLFDLSPIAEQLSDVIDLIPDGIKTGFGDMPFLTDLDWDDLSTAGLMTAPGEPGLVAGGDRILSIGDRVDLDTGEVFAKGDTSARMDADLVVRDNEMKVMAFMAPMAAGIGNVQFHGIGRSLAAVGASRVVQLANGSFVTTGYVDARSFTYPAGESEIFVPGSDPLASTPPSKTFAARTTEGRYSVCSTWTSSNGKTVLRFRTYDTPLPLRLDVHRNVTEIGKQGVSDILRTLHARYTAVATPHWSTPGSRIYQWYWSGTPLAGNGVLPNSTASYSVVGSELQITTQQGSDLKGWTCVIGTDIVGIGYSVCSNVNFIGRIPKPLTPGGGTGGIPDPTGPGGIGGGPSPFPV